MGSGKVKTSKGKVASSPFEKREVHLLSDELRNVRPKETKNAKGKEKRS